MNKTNWILGFLTAFFLASTAIAFYEGQTLTQQQLSETDEQTASFLDCKPTELAIDGEYLTQRVTCLQLSTNSEGSFELVPVQNNYTYPVSDILDCIAGQGISNCQQTVKNKWLEQHQQWVQELKNEINYWKNQPSQNLDITGFAITSQELNQ